MKLLRYGPNGHEMPGIIDDNGHIHDLSGKVRDISEEVLPPFSLDRLKRDERRKSGKTAAKRRHVALRTRQDRVPRG
jgi:hypothetical protein